MISIIVFCFNISSLILSKIITLASIAIPTVNIIPAIPGKDSVALIQGFDKNAKINHMLGTPEDFILTDYKTQK